MLDFNCLQNSVVKIGLFGSTSEAEGNRDITVAPLRLESITIRCGLIVDAIAFTYKDCHGLQHSTAQWGGNGGNSTMVISKLIIPLIILC